MSHSLRALGIIVAVGLPIGLCARTPAPGCEGLSARDCLTLALDAMGGKQRLEGISSIRLDIISHTALTEQSYRQAPFITSYERDKTTIDLAGQRLRTDAHAIWPESDPQQAETDSTLIVTAAGGGYHSAQGDSPCSRADLDAARERLALGPLRVLLMALAAPDLHYQNAEMLRSTAHAVVGFHWNQVPVRILLNASNHLPDAVETTQQFRDFWYYWGDVQQRVYWDNWKYAHGISYPSNEITERNGVLWSSGQALDVQFNVSVNAQDFAIDPKAAQQSLAAKGWERPFNATRGSALAPGIDLYSGSWNTTVVRQDDGIVILETPISALFTRGIFAEATRKYPGEKLKAVLSTSDSWPHVGGIRADVAQRLPVYVLDLNVPLLTRLVSAPHSIDPDPLQISPATPEWRVVSGRRIVGSGANRMELYPLRGASTERQYLVYFPQHRLLYASDTLVINSDHTLYDPQLMHEVRQAVEREHLAVDTVYAMHQGPTPWKDVLTLLDARSS
jgi:hypothetical protein